MANAQKGGVKPNVFLENIQLMLKPFENPVFSLKPNTLYHQKKKRRVHGLLGKEREDTETEIRARRKAPQQAHSKIYFLNLLLLLLLFWIGNRSLKNKRDNLSKNPFSLG